MAELQQEKEQHAKESEQLNQALQEWIHYSKKLESNIKSLQQQINTLDQHIDNLDQNIAKLQQENFELQGSASNSMSKFPTLDEVVSNYKYFGEQKFVSFFLKFDSEIGEDLTLFQEEIKHVLDYVIRKVEQIYPMHLLSQPSKFGQELIAYLQTNYQTIFNLSEDQISDFVPKKWRVSGGFAQSTKFLMTELHDLFLQIKLTPGLKFGELKYNSKLFKYPFTPTVPHPTALLPPLLHEGNVEAQGYAF
jgi:hypothetical protein